MKALEEQILKANLEYRNGTPIMSDNEYDTLVLKLKETDPQSELILKSILEQPSGDRMEELPIEMFSLEKVKTVEELLYWMNTICRLNKEDKLVITPKYDGISLCINEENNAAWTRGNGFEGQRSDKHYDAIKKHTKKEVSTLLYTFGEAIFPIKDFVENKGEYKSARNCVAGLFNSPDVSPMLEFADVVRYGTDMGVLDKSTQLSRLKESYPTTTTNWITTTYASFILDEVYVKRWLDEIFNTLCTKYKCDGLVIEVNSAEKRNRLGRLRNNNPKFAIAYKNPNWSEREETKVTGIEWNVSKDGNVKPVILIEPIDLCGATIQRASGYNAKYICDNHICEDALVVITRSGDVIPKHLKTVSYDEENYRTMCDEMMTCPSCGEPLKWDNTMTDLVCLDSLCEQRRVAELVYFFNTVGMEEFREPTIKKIYRAGYQNVVSILNITPAKLFAIEGIGNSLINTILSQFEKLKKDGVSLAKLMTAYNVFGGGLGEKTCQKIFDNLSKEDLDRIGALITIETEHLTSIEGIGEITAMAFNNGIYLYSKIEAEGISVHSIEKPKVKTAENQINVCFSGVRDKGMEAELISKGHKIASGVTSKTTHLVVKDPNSNSSKTVKARELGISIYSLEDFKLFV